jgi:hypothetical protein
MNLGNWRYLLVGAVVLNVPAMAGTLFQTGFEAPTYSLGLLHGQDSWTGGGKRLGGKYRDERWLPGGLHQCVEWSAIGLSPGYLFAGDRYGKRGEDANGYVLKHHRYAVRGVGTAGGDRQRWIHGRHPGCRHDGESRFGEQHGRQRLPSREACGTPTNWTWT